MIKKRVTTELPEIVPTIDINYNTFPLTGATYFDLQNFWLEWICSSRNVFIFGPQGSGKDTLIAHFLYLTQRLHYSNIYYDDNTVVTPLKKFGAGDNSFTDMINDTLKKYRSPFEEGATLIVSDAGAYFPSTESRDLDKNYPSMGIWLAFLRQLGHNSIWNAQAYGRLWIKIREQCDYFIKLIAPQFFDDYMLISAISYEKPESAEAGFLPTDDESLTCQRGAIEYHTFLVYYKELTFDSRYFRKKLLIE